MMLELGLYTATASAAHVMPIWKIRDKVAKFARIPVIGLLVTLAYSLGISWVVTTLFKFKSSIAGMANLLSAILFSLWLWFLGKK